MLICNYSDGEYNGVAAWMVYDLDDVTSVSFGPVGEIVPGNYISWNMERKQGMWRAGVSLVTDYNEWFSSPMCLPKGVP